MSQYSATSSRSFSHHFPHKTTELSTKACNFRNNTEITFWNKISIIIIVPSFMTVIYGSGNSEVGVGPIDWINPSEITQKI